MTGTVNMPVPLPPSGTLLGYEPGEVPHSTPRLVTAVPLSLVTLPPSVAVVSVTSANVGAVTVGAVTPPEIVRSAVEAGSGILSCRFVFVILSTVNWMVLPPADGFREIV